jgi:hypothetical protein
MEIITQRTQKGKGIEFVFLKLKSYHMVFRGGHIYDLEIVIHKGLVIPIVDAV